MVIVGKMVGQKLERDLAAEFQVLGFIDDAHPAPAELFEDAVMRDGLSDHWAEILGGEVGQVNEVEEDGCGVRQSLGLKPLSFLSLDAAMKGRSSTTVLGFPFFAQRSGNPMLAQQKFWERCFAKE